MSEPKITFTKREEKQITREAHAETRTWALRRVEAPELVEYACPVEGCDFAGHAEPLEAGTEPPLLTDSHGHTLMIASRRPYPADPLPSPARAERARVVREILVGLSSPFALTFRTEREALLAKAKDYNITASELLEAAAARRT